MLQTTLMRDTAPAASDRYFELLRQAGSLGRLQICMSLTRASRELALAGIRQSHAPRQLSEREERHYLAERLYGAEIAERYFPLVADGKS
jgi:hypothetical protein